MPSLGYPLPRIGCSTGLAGPPNTAEWFRRITAVRDESELGTEPSAEMNTARFLENLCIPFYIPYCNCSEVGENLTPFIDDFSVPDLPFRAKLSAC